MKQWCPNILTVIFSFELCESKLMIQVSLSSAVNRLRGALYYKETYENTTRYLIRSLLCPRPTVANFFCEPIRIGIRCASHSTEIDSNYFVLVRCHFRIRSQANTNVLKCSKHSYWPCESKPILLRRIASPNVVSIRVSSYWFVSHHCTFVSIRCTFALGFAACLLRLSALQCDAQRSHCRIGSHMFALVRVSSY